MALRSRLVALAALAAPGLASCVTGATGTPISLDDPLGLIDDSEELRLFILPAETYVCLDPSTGTLAPPIDVNAPLNSVEGAVVDLLLTERGSAVMQEVSVPPGDYVAYVRGKGTDPVSGVRNTVIGQGCVAIDGLASNESRGIALTLVPVITEGDCSDTILSPDEQCTTPGMGDCNATCQTTPFQLNTTINTGAQEMPRVSARGSSRIVTTFVSERIDVGARVLGPDGRALTSPALLANDRNVNEVLVETGFGRIPGVIVASQSAVASSGRMAIAATVVPRSGEFDVRVGFFDMSLGPEGEFVAVGSDTGRQDGVVGAFAADGSYLAAFVDGAGGGVAVRAFAAGSRTPSGSGSTVIGAGGAAPAVAGLATGFAVAYELSGRVMIQRVDGSGAAMGTAIAAADGSGDQSQPAIAPLASGGFVVAFRDSAVDGDGTGIRARVFDASGTGLEAFQVNSAAAGDQAAPAVAAHEDRIAIAFETGGAVHARMFDTTGGEALNREPTPSFSEFEIAPGATDPGVAATGSGTSALWFFSFRTLGDGLGDIYGRRIPR
ncbi:MAG: hypothetical protein K1X94_14265 [Sandaracinaceae bacterium]|nr:hypothetical protein [Sandaracinaceae bacterium]